MLFTSDRLGYRPWTGSDYDTLAGLLQDATTMHHWPAPLDDAAVQTWLDRNVVHFEQHGFSRFCCVLKADKTVIGDVGVVHASVRGQAALDLGYIIHADYWQQGFGVEAAAAVLDWIAGEQKLPLGQTIVATMATDNTGSAAIARRLGMELVDQFINANNLHKQTYYFAQSLAELTGQRR